MELKGLTKIGVQFISNSSFIGYIFLDDNDGTWDELHNNYSRYQINNVLVEIINEENTTLHSQYANYSFFEKNELQTKYPSGEVIYTFVNTNNTNVTIRYYQLGEVRFYSNLPFQLGSIYSQEGCLILYCLIIISFSTFLIFNVKVRLLVFSYILLLHFSIIVNSEINTPMFKDWFYSIYFIYWLLGLFLLALFFFMTGFIANMEKTDGKDIKGRAALERIKDNAKYKQYHVNRYIKFYGYYFKNTSFYINSGLLLFTILMLYSILANSYYINSKISSRFMILTSNFGNLLLMLLLVNISVAISMVSSDIIARKFRRKYPQVFGHITLIIILIGINIRHLVPLNEGDPISYNFLGIPIIPTTLIAYILWKSLKIFTYFKGNFWIKLPFLIFCTYTLLILRILTTIQLNFSETIAEEIIAIITINGNVLLNEEDMKSLDSSTALLFLFVMIGILVIHSKLIIDSLKMYKSACKQIENKEFSEAFFTLERVCSVIPNHFNAFLKLIDCMIKMELYREANDKIQKVLDGEHFQNHLGRLFKIFKVTSKNDELQSLKFQITQLIPKGNNGINISKDNNN